MMLITMPAEGWRGLRQTRRTRSKKSPSLRRRAIHMSRASTRHFVFIIAAQQISLMSGPRPLHEGLPGKRPAPVDPRTRRIGSVVGSDSFGTNEEIWHLFVRVGLIEAGPLCPECQRALPTNKARRDLHFSLWCHNCGLSVNVLANTPLWDVGQIRKFLATLKGWCNGDTVESILATTGISKRTWFKYRDIFNGVVSETLHRAREDGNLMLGGPGVIVEVDECHLHKRKYDRGNVLATEAIRAVGLIERRK